MATNKLSDNKVRQAKPKSKPFKLTDGGGLFVLVKPNGSKSWRLKYRHASKERLLTIGPYPDVSLADARTHAADARRLLREGTDPVQHRKRRTAETTDTFETIAEEWIASKANDWKPSYLETVRAALALNLYPYVGQLGIKAITVPLLRGELLRMQERDKLDTLRKVLMWASMVFRFAIGTGRAENDPASLLRGTFKSAKSKNFAAITTPEEFGQLIARIRMLNSVVSRSGLLLLAYTFVRTGELRGAEWKEIDFAKAEWRIPAERMKMGQEHVVPLSRQSLAVLDSMKTISGGGRFVFPNVRKKDKPMSENTLLYALYDLGYKGTMTGHGFRAAASSMLNDMDFDPDIVERQLAHQERNKVRAAYHRTEYLPQRKAMMQAWADHVDRSAALLREVKEHVSQT